MNLQRLRLVLHNPSLLPVALRRAFPLRAVAEDRECAHLVKSWSSGNLERRSATELFPNIGSIDVLLRKPYARVLGTAIDLPEAAFVCAILRLHKAQRVLEVGTNDGFSTLNFAANLPEGSSLTTVDLPIDEGLNQRAQMGANACDPNRVGSHFTETTESAKIRQVFADSQTLDWSTLGGPFDLIFVDACHEYQHVVNDTRNALSVLALGGVLIWHDYGLIPDVSMAVDEAAASIKAFAVKGTRLAVHCNAFTKQI